MPKVPEAEHRTMAAIVPLGQPPARQRPGGRRRRAGRHRAGGEEGEAAEDVILLGLSPAELKSEVACVLETAVANADLQMVRLCLTLVPEAARVGDPRLAPTPLVHGAIQPGEQSVAILEALLRARANPNCQAIGGGTRNSALHVACAQGNAAAVEVLLHYHADVSPVRNRNGETQLACALVARGHGREHCRCVRLLLQAGAPADGQAARLWKGRRSPLHAAAAAGCPLCVESLLVKRADPHARSHSADTPLHCAATAVDDEDSHEALSVLLRFKADTMALNNQGESPLHASVRAGNLGAMVRLAREDPRAAHLRNACDGQTPLESAAHSLVETCKPGREPEQHGALCLFASLFSASGAARTSRGMHVLEQIRARLMASGSPLAHGRGEGARCLRVPSLGKLCERVLEDHLTAALNRSNAPVLLDIFSRLGTTNLASRCETVLIRSGHAPDLTHVIGGWMGCSTVKNDDDTAFHP